MNQVFVVITITFLFTMISSLVTFFKTDRKILSIISILMSLGVIVGLGYFFKNSQVHSFALIQLWAEISTHYWMAVAILIINPLFLFKKRDLSLKIRDFLLGNIIPSIFIMMQMVCTFLFS